VNDIAIFGRGQVGRTDTLNLVKKHIDAITGGFRLIIPLEQDQSSAALWVAEWAQVQGHPYNVVYVDGLVFDDRQDSVCESALREVRTANIDKELANAKTLLVAMDDDEATALVVESALSDGARAFDLTDSLAELELDPEDDEQPSPAEPPLTVFVEEPSTTLAEIRATLLRVEAVLDQLSSSLGTIRA
jgi:hypothetical protein